MSFPSRLLLVCGLVLGLNTVSVCQETPDRAQGVSAFAQFQKYDFDNVNIINGNLYLDLPLLSYPQRGGKLRLDFHIYLNDKIWRPIITGPAGTRNPEYPGQYLGYWAASDEPTSGGWENPNNGGNPVPIAGAYIARDQHYDYGLDQQYASGTTWISGEGGTGVNNQFTVSAGSYFAVGPDGARHYFGDYGGYQCAPLNDGNCGSSTAMSWQSLYPAVDGSDIVPVPVGSASSTNNNLGNPNLAGTFSDADGIVYTETTPATPMPTSVSNQATDSNGNYIIANNNGWLDSLDRLIPGAPRSQGPGYSGPSFFSNDPVPGIPTSTLSNCPTGTTAARQWNPPSYQGAAVTYWLCYTTMNYNTAFGYDTPQYNIGDVASNHGNLSPAPAVMLTAIILPDGTSYSFQYDNYLSLTQLTLPTGGYIVYTWQTVLFPSLTYSPMPSRAVKTRTVYPGGGQPSGEWTYHWALPTTSNCPALANGTGTCAIWATITDPGMNDEVHFLGGTDANGTYWGSNLVETEVQYFTGCSSMDGGTCLLPNNQPIKTIEYSNGGLYSGNPATGSASLASSFTLTRKVSTKTLMPLAGGGNRTTTTTETYAPGYPYNCSCGSGPSVPTPNTINSSPSAPVFYMQASETYDANRIAATTYFDDGVGANAIRTDITAYAWQGNPNNSYQIAGLFNLPAAKGTASGSVTPNTNGTLPSNMTAATVYSYDTTTPNGYSFTVPKQSEHGSPPVSGAARGNLTSTLRALTLGASYSGPTTKTQWYDTGMPQNTWDALGNETGYSYDLYGTNNGFYVEQVTNAGTGFHTNATYDFYSGLVLTKVDMNAQTSTYGYDPNTQRVTSIAYPDGGGVAYQYTATTFPVVTSQTNVQGSNTRNMNYGLDGFGRVINASLANYPGGASTVTTSYDAFGRVSCVSEPYRNAIGGSTCTSAYDPLGRPLTITNPDNTTRSYSYSGEAVQASDEGNGTAPVVSVQQKDVLGRLLSVCEVTSATQTGGLSADQTPTSCNQDVAGTGFLTTYAYDILGNLKSVSQGSQTGSLGRSFNYDALSRLSNSYNPESGLTSFTYDADNGVLTRTRLSPNQPAGGTSTALTTYCYASTCSGPQDSMHRLHSITYSDSYANNPATPKVTFDYDSTSNASFPVASATNVIGRMVDAYTLNSSGQYVSGQGFSYDKMGREVGIWECAIDDCQINGSKANGWSYEISYQYDLLGDPTTQTLLEAQSGGSTTFTYTPNAIGQLSSVTSNFVATGYPATLLSNAQYTSAGSISSDSLGAYETETFGYDAMNRPSYAQVMSTTSGTQLYGYSIGTGGTVGQVPSTTGYAPNGDILAYADTVNGTWVSTYDSFNRIATAVSGSVNYRWLYDRFGNVLQQQHGPMATFPCCTTFVMPGNRSPYVTYDAAGNAIVDPSNSYGYDAENRVINMVSNVGGGSAQYSYDAEGKRVHRVSSTFTGAYVYDNQGRHFADMTPQGNVVLAEIYAGARHIATYNIAKGATYFIHTDWLGTERARSLYNGTGYETCTGNPFGDGQTCAGTDVSQMHFTGKERDLESNNDYFGARYYSSYTGRWLSPDWSDKGEAVPYASLGNPQSLNLYAYTGNNPLGRPDSDGHGWVDRFLTRNSSLIQNDTFVLARQQNAGASPSSDGTSKAVNLNIGGKKVTVAYSYGKIFSNYGGGVDITATPQNCSECAWAQVYSRGSGAKKDGDGIGPLYGDEGGGLSVFKDRPASSSPGSFTATTILGTTDISGKSFSAIGGFTYGYSMNGNGGVTMTAPSVATRQQMSGAIQVLQNNSPDWSIH